MRKIELEWDDENIDHIWFHHVIPEEIEEVLESRYLFELVAERSMRILEVVSRKKSTNWLIFNKEG